MLAGWLAGCASTRTTVVVVPNESDGKIGSIAISGCGGDAVADQAFVAVDVVDGLPPRTETLTATAVAARFADVRAARPPAPRQFQLYFLLGSDELTPESTRDLPRVIEELNRREVGDLMLIGHTDRLGDANSNDELSLRRAEALARTFEARGVSATQFVVSGRGERELLVPTDDGVAEPKNRRVEVLVR